MKSRNNGKILVFTGSVTVEGVSVDVTLEVNTVDLILQMGARAAHSRIGLCRQASGLLNAKVSRAQAADVHAAIYARKAADEARRNPHGYAIMRPRAFADGSGDSGATAPACVGIYASRGEALAMKNMDKGEYIRGATAEEYAERFGAKR